MKKVSSRYGGTSKEYFCPECGRRFLVPYQTSGTGKMQWVYRFRNRERKMVYLCSYGCYTKAKQSKENKE